MINYKSIMFILGLVVMLSCEKGNDEIKYASGYPSKLAGNWVVFQFQGGNLEGELAEPYDMVTALSPNEKNTLILDNLYNTKTRIKATIQGDTGFFAYNNDQLEVINYGNGAIEKVSIEGYINDNFLLKHFIYQLAQLSFPDMAFTEDAISEIIFFRAGYYDAYGSVTDTVMVMGYRKTGFEDEVYE
jgi:hypothetical protein